MEDLGEAVHNLPASVDKYQRMLSKKFFLNLNSLLLDNGVMDRINGGLHELTFIKRNWHTGPSLPLRFVYIYREISGPLQLTVPSAPWPNRRDVDTSVMELDVLPNSQGAIIAVSWHRSGRSYRAPKRIRVAPGAFSGPKIPAVSTMPVKIKSVIDDFVP